SSEGRNVLERALTVGTSQVGDEKAPLAQRVWGIGAHALSGEQVTKIDASVQAKALIVAAYLAFIQSDHDRAEPLFQESLALYRELEDQPGIAFALSLLGSVAWIKGHMVAARTMTEEALAISRQVD